MNKLHLNKKKILIICLRTTEVLIHNNVNMAVEVLQLPKPCTDRPSILHQATAERTRQCCRAAPSTCVAI